MRDLEERGSFGPLASAGVPEDREREYLDVAGRPPPKPLTETLEALAALPGGVVLIQTNARVPRHPFPKLESRGFTWESVEAADGTVHTAIWSSD